jgi:hypothetical protein
MHPDDIFDPHRPLQQPVDELRTALHLGPGQEDRAFMAGMPAVLRDLFHMQVSGDTGRPERPLRGALAVFCDHVEALTAAEPDAATLAAAPLIDRWSAILHRDAVCLIGRVTGHPRLRPGARAITSPLLRIAPAAGWARTWSRTYRLGREDRTFLLDVIADGRLPPTTEWVTVGPEKPD